MLGGSGTIPDSVQHMHTYICRGVTVWFDVCRTVVLSWFYFCQQFGLMFAKK
jgi:hypothetical protein